MYYASIKLLSSASRIMTLPLLLLLTLTVNQAWSAVTLCTDVQTRCMGRVGCSSAMRAYLLGCDEVLHGDAPEGSCPVRCRKALISLLSSEEQSAGEAFMTCDCQGDELCALQRRRLAVCTPDVLAAMGDVQDASTPIGCSLAELVCSADTSCLTALDYYRHHCRKLFQGLQCTQRCNNSLAVLHKVEKARKLRTCTCDGTEEYNCQALMTHTERLCFPHARHFHHHHQLHQRQHQANHAAVATGSRSSSHATSSAVQRKGASADSGFNSNSRLSAGQHAASSQYSDAGSAVASGTKQSSAYSQHQSRLQSQHQNQQQQQRQSSSSSQNAVPSICVYPLSLNSAATSSMQTVTWPVLSIITMLTAAQRTFAYLP